jgi:uncharacterized membrane protein YozB (DUF420 family)
MLETLGRDLMFAYLPPLIALLNAASAVLLVTGFIFIRRGNIPAHRRSMIAAFTVSVLFLAVYVVHHLHSGIVRYRSTGWTRGLYLGILGTHTALAALVPVLAIVALTLALRGRYARHRRWARWTFPAWLYVSVTGVVVYFMLYR